MTHHRGAGSSEGTARPDRDSWMPEPGPSYVDHSNQVVLPGYRDFVLIARSDSSEIYRAHQEGVERPVAVKVLLLDGDEAIARFERELEITVSLGRRHPHIVTVIDTGTTDAGRPCIVMEYYDLGSLHDRLGARGPLPWSEVLQAGTVVADALSFAHGHGVLHRDVKPQNILLLPTSYVVADFGIARPIDAGHTSSVEWFSFRHASPQVIDGLAPTAADDIWSVGSTLFTLLDGRAPFAAEDGEDDTALAYMRRVRTGHPRTLRRPDVPPGLVSIIECCLERERSDRFGDAAALHDALSALAAQTRAWAPRTDPAAAAEVAIGEPPPGHFADRPQVVAVSPRWQSIPAPRLTTARPAPAAQSQPRPAQAAAADETTGATVAGVMSPSAMANLVASIVEDSGYAPGDEKGQQTTTGRYTAGPPRSDRPRPLRRLLVIGLVALIAGGVLGVGIAAITRLSSRAGAGEPDERADSRRSPQTTAPARPPTTIAPGPSGVNINHPEIAPLNVQVDKTTTGAVVRWRDQTGGKAEFDILRIVDDKAVESYTVAPGTTELAVNGLPPAQAPYCFEVVAVVGELLGFSPKRCTQG